MRNVTHKMHVRTLNICFKSPKTFARRFGAFVEETIRDLPDAVCVQEATPVTCGFFVPLLDLYDISPFDPEALYFTLIIVRKGLGARFERIILPSCMQRDLLLAQLDSGLVVATVHLESMDNARIRRLQLAQVASELAGHERVVLAGDFNFCSYRNHRDAKGPLENDVLGVLLPAFDDAWVGTAGYTNGKYRLDRIMSKGILTSGACLVYFGVSDHRGVSAIIG